MDNLSKEVITLLKRQAPALAASLGQALQVAFACYEELSDQKGTLSHIYVSFLLSSVLCRLPLFRIDLNDENDLADIVPCYVEWDTPCITEHLYAQADLLASRQYVNSRMKEYEMEQLRLRLAETYFASMEAQLPLLLAQCDVASRTNIHWHYGYLYGQSFTIKEPTSGDDHALL